MDNIAGKDNLKYMKSTLVFIGPMGLGTTPKSGDVMKNQLFLDRFIQVFESVITVDTINWKRRPWIMVRLVWVLLFHKKAKVIVSANQGSADSLMKILKRLHLPNDCFYWVVGGCLHNMIKEGNYSVSTYSFLKGIFVQGQTMADSLKERGLTNAVYVPNSKIIDHYGVKLPKQDGKTHFVFLSRVEEYKGCTDIMKSVDALNATGYKGKFDVVFYGRESESADYAKEFQAMIDSHPETTYKGLLNLRDTKNYDELAQYDVMLFPTYWYGEGFPGIVIDAYISSLPIIASDWNLNKDVIEDGVTGWIIPTHDVKALTERMMFVIDHPEEVQRMSLVCRERAAQYDSRIVLSVENLKKIGVLSC